MITVPRAACLSALETAAEYEGVLTVRTLNQGYFHPGDPLGILICRAWQADQNWPSLLMVAYLKGLRTECERQEISAPTFETVLGRVAKR